VKKFKHLAVAFTSKRVVRGAMGRISPTNSEIAVKIFRQIGLSMCNTKYTSMQKYKSSKEHISIQLSVKYDQSRKVYQLHMMNQTLCIVQMQENHAIVKMQVKSQKLENQNKRVCGKFQIFQKKYLFLMRLCLTNMSSSLKPHNKPILKSCFVYNNRKKFPSFFNCSTS